VTSVSLSLWFKFTDVIILGNLADKVKAKHAQCMEHIWAGYLSDIIGLPMYFERGFEGGLSVYGTLRGTSQLESYHRWLRACMSWSRLCPELFVDRGSYWKLRQVGSTFRTQFVCINTICELYEYEDRTTSRDASKPKSKRCCIPCRNAGLGDFVQRQSGNRENTQFHGTNTVCVRLAKPSAPEMFDDWNVGPDYVEVQTGLTNDICKVVLVLKW